MTDSRWTLVCEWAGYTFEPTLAEDPRISARASFWRASDAERTADVSFVDEIGVARLVAQGHRPQTGTAILSYDGVEMVRGNWRNLEYGALFGVCAIEFGQAIEDDRALIPGYGDVQRRLTDDELSQTAYIQERSEYPVGLLAAEKIIYGNVARASEGRILPLVFGAPGTVDRPGSPAIFADTVTDGGRFIIALGEVAATTVRLWGPDSNGDLVKSGAMDVFQGTDPNGVRYAFVKFSDANIGSVTADPEADYFTSWTDGDALPGGAGDVMITLLGLSSLYVDYAAWEAYRDRLNLYVLAGYVDDQVSPAALALKTIAKDLPIGARYGVNGLQPTVWPWLDDEDAAQAVTEIVAATPLPDEQYTTWAAGTECRVLSRVGFTGDGTVTSSTIQYGYDPESTNYTQVATLSPSDSAYGALAISRAGASVDATERKTRWVNDEATATGLALQRMRAESIPRRTIRLACPPATYGPGGIIPLSEGMGVKLTIPDLHIEDRPAHIDRITWSTAIVEIILEIRDDPLSDG